MHDASSVAVLAQRTMQYLKKVTMQQCSLLGTVFQITFHTTSLIHLRTISAGNPQWMSNKAIRLWYALVKLLMIVILKVLPLLSPSLCRRLYSSHWLQLLRYSDISSYPFRLFESIKDTGNGQPNWYAPSIWNTPFPGIYRPRHMHDSSFNQTSEVMLLTALHFCWASGPVVIRWLRANADLENLAKQFPRIFRVPAPEYASIIL